jgi:hypothetical protein
MERDIDYAAVAVKNALVEKYAKGNDLQDLEVLAGERTICIRHGDRQAAGSRHELLAAIRHAETYERLWEELPATR